MNYRLEKLTPHNSQIWEEFNNNSNEGTFFHSIKWMEIVGNIELMKQNCFLVFRENELIGILPFIQSRKKFFNGLDPLPHTEFNHCIISDHHDPYILPFILEKFQKKCSYIAINTLHQELLNSIRKFQKFPFLTYGNLVINLKKYPPDRIWGSFSAKKGQRKFIRRFDEHGFTIKEITSQDDLKLFYKYYAKNIEHIGGNLQLYSHFDILWNKLFPNDMRITLLSKDNLIAGGLLLLKFTPQKKVYFNYLALNRDLENTFHPTYSLFWEGINWAWNSGFEEISLGGQDLELSNPRYRLKMDFGADFIPNYSKIISLSRFFTIAYRCHSSMMNIQHFLKDRIWDTRQG